MRTQSPPAITQGVPERIRSVDVARGLAMVLMALDHVRVYSGVPPGSAEPAVFLTRWVTHFCAPAFVFLAGTSAFLAGRRRAPSALARWLVVRGLWLVLLELTFLRLAWTFNLEFGRYMLAGVIWMIGWSMVVMALVVRLPAPWTGVLGLALVAGHNLSAFVPADTLRALLEGRLGWLWKVLYFGGGLTLGDGAAPNFFVLYSLIPWVGVMALGYAFGGVLRLAPQQRQKACFAIGLGAIVAFAVLRTLDVYGDRPWAANAELPGWLAFLNATKYPASFLFLLMTLGPTIAALPFLERGRGRVAGWLAVFGRVPFFYYLAHIPLIHAVTVVISLVRTPDATNWLFQDHPLRAGPAPEGYVWSLGLVYAVTWLVVLALYAPCRWFAEVKARKAHAWLGYL